jgi:Ca2+-binding RTX toxin-like protein
MTAIDFGNFPAGFAGVNMSTPAALGQAILSNFGNFNFSSGYRDGSLVQILNGNGLSDIWVHGSFGFSSGLPTGGSRVLAIEIWTPEGYRLFVDDINVSWATLQSALNARNLSPLWAGQALEIHGHAVLADTLVGGALGDEIWGYGGNDVLTGNGGNDYLDGMGGNDTMRGGLGHDDYAVTQALDVVEESADQGVDLVVTTVDGYQLPANVEDLALLDGGGAIDGSGNGLANYVEGNLSANRLDGISGQDTLSGLEGDDTLAGGKGADSLVGGGGADVLLGGDDNDQLVWDSADTSVNGGGGIDTLRVASGGLNLLNVDTGMLIDIERISLTGGGANALTLAASDILDISSTTNVLRVLGEAGDTVNLPSKFAEIDTVGGYTRYRSGAAIVWVDSDISVI